MQRAASPQPSWSRRAVLAGAGAALSSLPFASRLAAAASSSAGMEAGWPKVTALLDRYVAERRLPGASAAFGWGDGPLGHILRGKEGFDDADDIGPDSLFRIYSMTKPITGMLTMMLIEEGRLSLDQKLADIAPEFAEMRVAIDPAQSLDSRPAKMPITIRHLLTHTAGFAYAGVTFNKVGDELLRLGLTPAVISRLAIPNLTPPVPTPDADEFLRRAASVPLLAEPGTKWLYSMSFDILGIVVERVSGGTSLATLLAERLFAPAGMRSTFFRVPEEATGRLATNYGVLAGIPLPIDRPADSLFLDRTPFAFGGAGLVSTAADYDRFLRMILGKGLVDGRRVMSESAVAMGISNLLPPGIDTKGTMTDGGGFGAGGLVGLGADAGTFGWSGAAGTIAFVNTRIGLRAGLYVQFLPPDALPLQREFREAARDDVLGRMKA